MLLMKLKEILVWFIILYYWITLMCVKRDIDNLRTIQQDTGFTQVSDIFYIKKWNNICRERLIDCWPTKCTWVWSWASEMICDF